MKSSLVRIIAFVALMAAMAPDDAFCKGGGGGGGGRGGGGFSGGGGSRGFSGSSGGIKSGGGVKTSGFGASGGSNRSATWGSGNASKAAPSSKISGGGASKSWGKTTAPAAPSAPKISGGGASKAWSTEMSKPAPSPSANTVTQKTPTTSSVSGAKAESKQATGPSFSVERDTTAKKQSASAAVDERIREKAAMSGSGTKSRQQEIDDLKAREAKSYQTTFAKEPATRPDYIPKSTTVGNTTVNVVYDTRYGGYGYMSGGSWRMYDPFMDLLMWDMLLNRHAAPVVVTGPDHTVVYPARSGGSGVGFVVGTVLFVVIVGACVCVVARR